VASERNAITATELCKLLDVADMTIGRDLKGLNRERPLRGVHGGALSSLGRSCEPPCQIRTTQQMRAEQALGKVAAGPDPGW